MTDRVLIVTGSLISTDTVSIYAEVKKQLGAFRASSAGWLDLQSKLVIAEQLCCQALLKRSGRYRRAAYCATADKYFDNRLNWDTPELTEVILATLLEAEGIAFEVASYSELYADRARRDQLLDQCRCVFASTTLLRDVSELSVVIQPLKRPGNHVVAGGALVSMLAHDWPGCAGIDLLAVGYGERLVPALAQWIRSGYRQLVPPPGGSLGEQAGTAVLHSGLPAGTSLDHLAEADWKLAEGYRGRPLPMVYYESARGCPYSCAFCNYPALFDDTRFRTKSAARIAADWTRLANQGVRVITCLDSLFTMPKRRLLALCDALIERQLGVQWICYARADDLSDVQTCQRMKAAGCLQVQIGLESGNQQLLDNMNKQCTVQSNLRAVRNCREAGITSFTTIIIGFPGETEATVRQSLEMLRSAPPDLYYAAAFNTRFEGAPILSPEYARKFGLVSLRGGRSAIPYWRHDTMSAAETCRWLRWFNRTVAEQRLALDGSLFYGSALGYRPSMRDDLLAFQADIYRGFPIVRAGFAQLDRWVQRKLDTDIERRLPRRQSG